MNTPYDVVIVGAGISGATLAAALAGGPRRVALVDVHDVPQPDPDGYDLRVSAVTRGSEQVFRRAGAWDNMVRKRVSPFREMHVWDAGGSGSIHFDSAELGQPQLGHIIENRVMIEALTAVVRAAPNVERLVPRRVESITDADDVLTLVLDDGSRLTTRLLVAADGGRSLLRRHAGIRSRGWSYGQQGIVATVSTGLPHRETAWQRFTGTGPVAFLPLADGRCSVVWSVDDRRAAELMRLGDQEFCHELERAFEARLGEVTGTSRRAGFPLGVAHAERYYDHRIVLIGDAAHRIHPLAGQGANLGIADAAALAQLLGEHAGDPGDPVLLQRYQRRRKGDILLVAAVMDGFKHLFGTGITPLRVLRNLGLSGVDRAGPFKHLIMERAMGLHEHPVTIDSGADRPYI